MLKNNKKEEKNSVDKSEVLVYSLLGIGMCSYYSYPAATAMVASSLPTIGCGILGIVYAALLVDLLKEIEPKEKEQTIKETNAISNAELNKLNNQLIIGISKNKK